MNRSRFRIQVACVLALIAFVQWPQFRSVRAITIWGASGSLTPRPELIDEDPRIVDASVQTGIVRVGYGSLSAQAPLGGVRRSRRLNYSERGRGVTTAASATALGARWNALTCVARTSLNEPVPFARLVLRDATTGQIEAHATADGDGRCTFLDVAPSDYILELVGADGAPIASSGLVSITDGASSDATVMVSSNAIVGAIFGGVQSGAREAVDRAVESGAQGVNLPAATNSPQQ